MTYPRVIRFRGICGDMPAIGEPMHADPRTGDMPGGLKLVPTVWAQRAVNAYAHAVGLSVSATVDGISGPLTRQGLQDAVDYLSSTGVYGTLPDPVIVDGHHLAIPTSLLNVMSVQNRIADPAGSTVGVCNWDAPAQTVVTQTMTDGSTAPSPASSMVAPARAAVSHFVTDLTTVGTNAAADVLSNALAFGIAAIVGAGAVTIVFRKKRGRR